MYSAQALRISKKTNARRICYQVLTIERSFSATFLPILPLEGSAFWPHILKQTSETSDDSRKDRSANAVNRQIYASRANRRWPDK